MKKIILTTVTIVFTIMCSSCTHYTKDEMDLVVYYRFLEISDMRNKCRVYVKVPKEGIDYSYWKDTVLYISPRRNASIGKKRQEKAKDDMSFLKGTMIGKNETGDTIFFEPVFSPIKLNEEQYRICGERVPNLSHIIKIQIKRTAKGNIKYDRVISITSINQKSLYYK